MRVIATAGHIDHGKSSLVQALTGIDPDRLPEEKARGMTIELGFAWLNLADGTPGSDENLVGVIDVPGHERFVRHMLAGVGGIDLALLVVAADETVMPQTREHLAILDLLDVRHGVVALTKCDLVDEEWLQLAMEEVQAALAGTSLAKSPIVPCSSVTGAGLPALRATLARALATTPERSDRGRPHLPIDRVFTRSGYGTIVTGTLLDGSLSVGQEVELVPGGPRARIRGLQSHHVRLERAGPGRRLAVNLAGVAVEEVSRGMVLCLPGTVPTAQYLDLRLRVVRGTLPGLQAHTALATEVTNNMAVTLHTGTVEAPGRLRLLDADRLGAGEEGWAQVRLNTPIAALRGDRCVLRVPSPAATVAGGTIVVVNPARRRRFDAGVVQRLAILATATPEELIQDMLAAAPATVADLATRADLSPDRAGEALANLSAAGRARPLRRTHHAEASGTREQQPAGAEATGSPPRVRPGEYWAAAGWLNDATRRVGEVLTRYHLHYPLRRGMTGESLRDALQIERKVWANLLERWQAEGIVRTEGELVWLAGHSVAFAPEHERQAQALLEALRQSPYAPPAAAELPILEEELLAAMLDRGDVVRIAEGLLLHSPAFEAMRDWALGTIDADGQVTVAALRDHFETSRKVALALLEYLDDLRLTRRLGDVRVRGTGGARPAVLGAGGGSPARE